MQVINRLKVVLAEQRRTNRWLAEKIGKSENTISKWCSNKSQPSLDCLLQIARLLDVDVRDLLVSLKDKSINIQAQYK